MNCARHLANHGAKVVVFAPSFMRMNPALETELKLLESTTATRTTSTKGEQHFYLQAKLCVCIIFSVPLAVRMANNNLDEIFLFVFFCFIKESVSELFQILSAFLCSILAKNEIISFFFFFFIE